MNIIPEISNKKTTKPEIEQVVKEKMEYSLLGTYNITNGFNLFAYSSVTGKIREVEIKRGEFIQCELTTEGWIWFDPERMSTIIDSKEIYFEAFNMKSAINMVAKFKDGKKKELFNLKKPTKSTINIFEHI